MRQVVGMKSAMETVAVAVSDTGGPSVVKSPPVCMHWCLEGERTCPSPWLR